MFGSVDDQVAARWCCCKRSLDRQIIRLGRSTGENHVAWLHVHQACHLFASDINGSASDLTVDMVQTGGIAVLLLKERQHRCQNASVNWSRCVMVQVDWKFWRHDIATLALRTMLKSGIVLDRTADLKPGARSYIDSQLTVSSQ